MSDPLDPSLPFVDVLDVIEAIEGGAEIVTIYPERLWHFSSENAAAIQPKNVRTVITESEVVTVKINALARMDCAGKEVTADVSAIPVWVQPTGAPDAYPVGSGWVQHNGRVWVNILPVPNVWEPGVYGWDDPLTPIPEWVLGPNYQLGNQRTYNGILWLNRRENNNQGFAPGTNSSGWMQVSPLPAPYYNLGNEGWPIGATATDAGHLWENTVADNTFAPGVFGWVDLGAYEVVPP